MNDLSEDIKRAKQNLSMPEFLRILGDGDYAKKSAKSPFRDGDNKHCFGIFERTDGTWAWKDQVTGNTGDEIDYLMERHKLDKKSAQDEFLRVAGIDREASNVHSKFKRAMTGLTSQVSAAPTQFNWQEYKDALTDDIINKIAMERGISIETIEELKEQNIIGAYNGHPAFSVNNGKAAHFRVEDRTWRYSPSGTACTPLIFGNESSNDILAFESQWDAIAVADRLGKDYRNSVLFIATRGASNGNFIGPISKNKTIFTFPQNDQPKKDGKIPSEEWFNDVVKSSPEATILRVNTPKEHKDVNDWTRSGANEKDIQKAITAAEDPGIKGVQMLSFKEMLNYEYKDDKTTLLGDRWVCEGGSCLWIGASGIGKSSLTLQAAMTWSLGLPFFGVQPKRPLKSLFIQAENDTGDMAEMVEGVIKRIQSDAVKARMDPKTISDYLKNNIIFARDTIHTGREFTKVASHLARRHRPDLFWVDPLLSYVGDDISQQKVASDFLRNQLNPISLEHKFAWMLVHHTGKPQSDTKSRSHWNESDYAYIGLGSSELTNWARAVNVLQGTRHDNIFTLKLAKRGKRCRVIDEDHQPTNTITLKHSEMGISWEACEMPEDDESKPGAKPVLSPVQKVEIKAFLAANPGITLQAAIDKFDLRGKSGKPLSKSTVSRALKSPQ